MRISDLFRNLKGALQARAIVLLTVVTLIGPGSAFAGIPDCEHVLKSVLFLSQIDRRLEKAGLWDNNGHSNLCGPVCILNALNVVRKLKTIPFLDPISEIHAVVAEVQKQNDLGDKAVDDVREGASHETIGAAIGSYFTSQGIPIEVREKLAVPPFFSETKPSAITADDFPTAAGGPLLTIVEVYGNLQMDSDLFMRPRIRHFMLAVDFDPKMQLLTLVDPFNPEIPLYGKLEPVEGRTFTISFDRVLLTGLQDFAFAINVIISFTLR